MFFGLLGRIVSPLGLVREAKVKVKVNSRTVFTRTVKKGIETKIGVDLSYDSVFLFIDIRDYKS